jgi:hypothetical protein
MMFVVSFTEIVPRLWENPGGQELGPRTTHAALSIEIRINTSAIARSSR